MKVAALRGEILSTSFTVHSRLANLFRRLFGLAEPRLEPPPASAKTARPPSAVELVAPFSRRADYPPPGTILPEYDESEFWPTPDWEARRAEVLLRDGHRCQAPGCLNEGSGLHAHHIKARWQGGNHRLENLVALCEVHHALVHLDTNALRIRNSRCAIVSRHWRRLPFSNERTEVVAYVRRFVLVRPDELKAIRERFKLACACGSLEWKGNFRAAKWMGSPLVWTACPQCNERWEFEAGLVEETGTQLALAFPPVSNSGRLKFGPELIRGLRKPLRFEGCPECLRHGRQAHLVLKRGIHGKFWGCSDWPICRYTRNFATTRE